MSEAVEEANFAVTYPGPTQERVKFAWFITRADAKVFADTLRKREDVDYKVVAL